MKVHTVHFSPVACHLIPLRAKYKEWTVLKTGFGVVVGVMSQVRS